MTRRRFPAGALRELGPDVLARAENDLLMGIVETSFNGGNARIAEMDAYVGAVYGSDGWSAPAVSAWIIEAAKAAGRHHPPIPGGKTGVDVVVQLKAARRWLDAAIVRANPVVLLRPGVITAFKADPHPQTTSTKCGILRSYDGSGMLTTLQGDAAVDGGSGDRLRVVVRPLSDVRFLGIGTL
jgi:hypothetical protein